MTFSDGIKQSILEGFMATEMTTGEIVTTLAIAFGISIYIFILYRIITKSAFYSKTFNISMATISIVTAAIILAMQSSLVISLGMVGALSIVRFRTAIKDPMDLLFLFWSIGTGIICGSGLYKIALVLALVITIAIALLELLPNKHASLLLIINSSDKSIEGKLIPVLKDAVKSYKVKSRNITQAGIDIIFELRVSEEAELVNKVSGIQNIDAVSLIAHDGEFRG